MKKKSKKKGKVNKVKTFRTVGISCVVIAITVAVMLITNNNGGYFNNAKKCDPGKYLNGSKCVTCPKGSYCNGVKRKYCPKGKSSVPGESNITGCEDCAKGYYSKGDGKGCLACKVGYYQDKAGQTSCKKCPNGTTTTKTGQTTCKEIVCKTGEYLNGTKCVTCPKGSYCVDNVKTACPKGMYQDKTGQTSCKLCPSNKKTKSVGSTSSSACSIKTVCATGQYLSGNNCYKCPKGSYCDRDQKFSCPNGTYQDKTGQSVCKKCSSGKVSNSTKTECITETAACYKNKDGMYVWGKFANVSGYTRVSSITSQSKCVATACAAGQYLVGDLCYNCSVGHYCKNNVTTPCPKGTYQDQRGQSSCKQCPSGTTTSSAGSVSASSCNVSTSTTCPNGKYLSGSGCYDCPIGHFCKNGNKTACAKGTYQDKKGQVSCIACPSGKTTSSTGSVSASSCTAKKVCAAGQYLVGDLCYNCPVGYYCRNNVKTACPKGTYQDQRGQSSCKQCPSGKTTSTTGSTRCSSITF